jgi:hypothetical protein
MLRSAGVFTVAVLLVAAALQVVDAQVITTAGFAAALNSTQSTIVVQGPLTITGQNWSPITVDRQVTVAGAGGATISLQNYSGVPIFTADGGKLTLKDLVIIDSRQGQEPLVGSIDGKIARVVFDNVSIGSKGCVASGQLAYDSRSLRAAMEDATVSRVAVTNDITLGTDVFPFRPNFTITRGLDVVGCSGVKLDVAGKQQVITVAAGGMLRISNITLAGSQTFWERDFPSFNDLFVSALEAVSGGGVVIQDASIIVSNITDLLLNQLEPLLSAKAAVPRLTASGNTQGTSMSALIDSWVVTAGDWASAQGKALAPGVVANTSWSFSNVAVSASQAGKSCFEQQGSFKAANGQDLLKYLKDPAVTRIEVINNITLDPAVWPNEASGPNPNGINITVGRSVEIRGCHPEPGKMYTIDFSDIGQVLFVFGRLKLSGDLYLTNPRASPRRAYLFSLIGAMSVEEDGIIDFQVGNSTADECDASCDAAARGIAHHNISGAAASWHQDPRHGSPTSCLKCCCMPRCSLAWVQVHGAGVGTSGWSCYHSLMHVKALLVRPLASPQHGCVQLCGHDHQQTAHSQSACDVSMLCRVWRSMAT